MKGWEEILESSNICRPVTLLISLFCMPLLLTSFAIIKFVHLVLNECTFSTVIVLISLNILTTLAFGLNDLLLFKGGSLRNDPETAVAPIGDSKLPTDDIDNRTFAQICLAPLAFPPKGTSIMKWIYWVLAWPIRFCLCLTTPDCRCPRWRRWQGHWLAFIVSCFWIGVFTIFMMWMITVIG